MKTLITDKKGRKTEIEFTENGFFVFGLKSEYGISKDGKLLIVIKSGYDKSVIVNQYGGCPDNDDDLYLELSEDGFFDLHVAKAAFTGKNEYMYSEPVPAREIPRYEDCSEATWNYFATPEGKIEKKFYSFY